MSSFAPSPVFWAVAAAGLVAVSGCGKKNETRATPPPADTVTQPAPTNPPVAAQASQPGSSLILPNGEVDMPELQRSVIRWILAHRRRPANFEEFAATAGVQIPPPPAGKKYFLAKDMHVRLVDR